MNSSTFFVEFHLPAPVVDYIQSFTTHPVDHLAIEFLFNGLDSNLPLLLPVPSRIVIGCFSVNMSTNLTVIFSITASDLSASVLESLLRVLNYEWIAHLSMIRAPNLPICDPPSLDVDLLEQSSLILLPSEERHFSSR
ncbi:E4-5 [Deer mastadenovirus B]|uniref:E4-5 n=1 Tax=Deer mastadenovirus B TaxID=2170000 RepID=A0A1Y0B6H9_9ADEN|nr:E4-5 [Deer mastadenovirus B]ART33385.1 E4-5 [Deer mastadenovirus B]